LAAESTESLRLQEQFKASILQRLTENNDGRLGIEQLGTAADLVFSTVHKYFVDQGLYLAAFLEKRVESLGISETIVEDLISEAIADLPAGRKISPQMIGSTLATLRGLFYRCSDVEREYLQYLCRTSCLLVTMQSAPRLLEYLNQMGGNFRLIVGSDILVRAISERYLPDEQQQVSNLLRVCKRLGAELILTEPAVSEVFTHLHATDLEFRNHYERHERYLGATDIAECDRIMIRAYLHARGGPGGPRSWSDFVNQLTDPQGLRSKTASARSALKSLLQQRFGMAYLSREDLEESVPLPKVRELAKRIMAEDGKHEELAYNDALMVYATYAQRRAHDESGNYDGFGYRTWWLTKETLVLSKTADVVRAEGGLPYVMRPEFVLNFVALAPKAEDARRAFARFLPTSAGLQMGQHLKPEVMHQLLEEAGEWARLTPERVGAMMSERVDKLKYDRFKRYLAVVK
jgi:hypothetical protein